MACTHVQTTAGGRGVNCLDCGKLLVGPGEAWSKTIGNRWIRIDGAVVKWDDSSPWPNPAKDSARMWTAWEPDPSEAYLRRGNKRGIGWPRRWKHPERAMQEVDRLFPLATT